MEVIDDFYKCSVSGTGFGENGQEGKPPDDKGTGLLRKREIKAYLVWAIVLCVSVMEA